MKDTHVGTIHIFDPEGIFKYTLESIKEAVPTNPEVMGAIGLTGGSTPKAFYQWVIKNNALAAQVAKRFVWTTSDERCVPITSDESNFGNARRMLFEPLGLPKSNQLPWPTHCAPPMAANIFNRSWDERFSPDIGFDICFLGMGDDCHIASIFPNSSLIDSSLKENFTHVFIPGKGDRLTITQAGLKRSKKIIITAIGGAKSQALKLVFNDDYNPSLKPAQILKQYANKVIWLLDQEAATSIEDYL